MWLNKPYSHYHVKLFCRFLSVYLFKFDSSEKSVIEFYQYHNFAFCCQQELSSRCIKRPSRTDSQVPGIREPIFSKIKSKSVLFPSDWPRI